jgi:hypothetical protein
MFTNVLTHQQMFTNVLINLTRQGVASTVPDEDQDEFEDSPTCAYRGDKGRKCAAGHLILDQHYRHGMEGDAVRAGQVRVALVKSGAPETSEAFDLLQEMQWAHDNFMPGAATGATLEGFHDRMRYVAEKFNLEFTLET